MLDRKQLIKTTRYFQVRFHLKKYLGQCKYHVVFILQFLKRRYQTRFFNFGRVWNILNFWSFHKQKNDHENEFEETGPLLSFNNF